MSWKDDNKETTDRLLAERKVEYPIWIFIEPGVDIRKAQERWKGTAFFQAQVLCALMREALEPLVGWRKVVVRVVVWMSGKLRRR
jgi:hypothetical protein